MNWCPKSAFEIMYFFCQARPNHAPKILGVQGVTRPKHVKLHAPAQWGSLQDPRRGPFSPPIARFCSLTRVLFSSKPRHSVMICLIEILDFDYNSCWALIEVILSAPKSWQVDNRELRASCEEFYKSPTSRSKTDSSAAR